MTRERCENNRSYRLHKAFAYIDEIGVLFIKAYLSFSAVFVN